MTHKLVPATEGKYVPPEEVVRRFRDEFEVVEADLEEGRDHVQAMLLQFIKMKQGGLPDCDEHIVRLQKVQEDAVFVTITDDEQSEDARLRFAVIRGEPIIVGYWSGQHQRLAEPLLKRCAEVLGYQITWA